MPAITSQNPTLLLFSSGPVQDFIAAARTTRDLWSGSYLLSTLAAEALCEVEISGGEVIFPHIKGQPLVKGNPATDGKADRIAFLTPTLPNRFLASIPSDLDPKRFADAAQAKLMKIANDVKNGLPKNKELPGLTFLSERFIEQAERLLEVQWQTLPITDPKEIFQRAQSLPKNDDWDPCKHVDSSSSIEELWGPLNATIAWLLDGNKSLRQFNAWSTGEWKSGADYFKDQLNGKEEAVFTVSNKLNDHEVEILAKELKLNTQGGLKKGETLGASSVIKRFWGNFHLTKIDTLPSDPHLLRKAHPMPNTHAIARYETNSKDCEDLPEPSNIMEKYFAIIAMDGDQMGQWVSGAKYKKAILEKDHADFSETSNDFSVNKAALLVDDSVGKLIYSGGDDVLAMLPAGNALACAEDLRKNFIDCFKLNDAKTYAKIDASVGIAIAHYKSPLQDVVKAAQAAEKRAKRSPSDGGHGRAAVDITIYKRSGEILEWGGKWDSGGLKLLEKLKKDLSSKKLNARFPHKLEAQLTPYLATSESIKDEDDFTKNFTAILELEVNHTLNRNAGGTLGETVISDFTDYWNELNKLEGSYSKKLTLFINLLRTAAWMVRGEDRDAPQQAETNLSKLETTNA